MSYQFKQIHAGPRWQVIQSGFPRRSAGEAFARDWLAARGFTILLLEYDEENSALDLMAVRGEQMEQFAVEPEAQP